MEELNLSDRRAPREDGIRGRFVLDWKTIAAGLIAALFAWSALTQRMSTVEAKYDNLAQQINAIEQQQKELRADVKELLLRSGRQP